MISVPSFLRPFGGLVLWLVCLLPQVAQAQYELKFRYEVDISGKLSEVMTLRVDEYIVHETTLFSRDQPIKVTSRTLATIEPGNARLRLVFTPVGNLDLLSRSEIILEVKAFGALKADASKQTITLGRSKDSYIDFLVAGEGNGSVEIKVVEADLGERKVRDDGYNQLGISYGVQAFKDSYQRTMSLEENQMASKVKQVARLYDRFPAFASSEYDKVKNVDVVRDGLKEIREKIKQWHDRYQQEAQAKGAPFSAAWEYYQVFGLGESPLLSPYNDMAQQALREADDRLWAKVDLGKLSSIEGYIQTVANLAQYQPRHLEDARRAIDQWIDVQVKQAKQCDEVDALLAKLAKLENSRYYQTKPGDPRFAALRKKQQACGGPSCDDLFQQAIDSRGRSACVSFLNSCQNEATANQIAQIKAILKGFSDCDRCGSDYRTIERDTLNLTDYKAMIQALLSDCEGCLNPAQREQLHLWQKRTAPMVLRDNIGPNKSADGESYSFTLTFASGKGIELYQLDGRSDSVYLAEALREILRWEWLAEDSVLKITVLDAQEHELLLKAASADTLRLNFKRERFQGTLTDLGESLVVDLSFGDEPYVLELRQGAELRFIPLDGPRDTLYKADLLAQNFDGTYTLAVRDFFSRRVSFENHPPLVLNQPIEASLWMWLILPLLLAVGLLVWRNLRPSSLAKARPPKLKRAAA